MKKTLIAIAATLFMTGCAGLSASGVLTITYNAEAQTISNITPGVKQEAKP